MNRLEGAGVPEDAGRDVKARLRADLRAAMKGRHAFEAKVIRALVAAIDNAEVPPTHAGQTAPVHHHFHSGSAEVERLLLSRSDVRRNWRQRMDVPVLSLCRLCRLGMRR